MHVADLLDPLRRGMMRRMRSARNVIDQERFLRRKLLELLHVLDGLIGHGGLHVPGGIVQKWIDGRRVAIQIRLPLAGVATDEAPEVFEAHSVWPLVERTGFSLFINQRGVFFSQTRRG